MNKEKEISGKDTVQIKANVWTINRTVTTTRHKELLSRAKNKNVKTRTRCSDWTACFRSSSTYSELKKGRHQILLETKEASAIMKHSYRSKKKKKKKRRARCVAASGILRRWTRDYIQAAANSLSISTTRNRSDWSCGQKGIIKPQNSHGKKRRGTYHYTRLQTTRIRCPSTCTRHRQFLARDKVRNKKKRNHIP